MPKNCVARPSFSSPWFLAPLFLALTLSGCAVSPIQEETSILAPIPTAELNRALILETQGQPGDAAKIYLDLAAKAEPPAKAQLRIKAARAYLAGGQTTEARATLDAITQTELTAGQRELFQLTRAELSLTLGRPKDAIADLERMRTQGLPNDLKTRRLGALASALRLDNQPVAAAEALSEIDRLLVKDERLFNQVSLVSTLSALDGAELRKLTSQGRGPMKGWADIALLARHSGADPSRMESSYREWHQKHPAHPALPELGRAYAETLSGGYAAGDRVTVMLPSGGRFAAAAKAVRDGIEAARRADRGEKQPVLDFADSTNAGRVRALHAAATKQGARYVIGPLEKPAVDALTSAKALSVPTLALNEATRSDRRAENLFQFSLSPENEAAEAASKGAGLGAKTALVLYPENAWGQRLANAFQAQWRNQGGTLAGQASFNPAGSNHGKTLSKLIGGKDADMLFLVATDDMAREIHPQIRAATTKPLMVISTSHVYSGRFDATRDKPLVGLYFVDIPWMLDAGANGPLSRRAVMGQTSSAAGPLARLYAMGIDAYRLTPRLTELARNPGAYHPGQTGGLAVDSLGRITRRLELGRFTETGPRPAEASGKASDAEPN
ncbi:penicillin-binding protein activator [Thiocystis violacea]|uniref:penicillin-binding protein activator n=1 Tax=Thiocystis violacea TaxID=13725 RepID=UPI0019064D10|nr:penicillin-binding protein activator [Thiocystis violacea]MBK1716481.1 penicillin-binding protein activator [Thiocystis violacea]